MVFDKLNQVLNEIQGLNGKHWSFSHTKSLWRQCGEDIFKKLVSFVQTQSMILWIGSLLRLLSYENNMLYLRYCGVLQSSWLFAFALRDSLKLVLNGDVVRIDLCGLRWDVIFCSWCTASSKYTQAPISTQIICTVHAENSSPIVCVILVSVC